MILYINCCVRDESRTNQLAQALLNTFSEPVEELYLPNAKLEPLSAETLSWRSEMIAAGDFSDSYFDAAKQFAHADKIVIAAPYWDLSFPSLLKIYFENIYIIGLTSSYNEQGIPVGLCNAKTLYYVSTAGGPFCPNFGYQYVHDLTTLCFGVKETKLLVAENLDVVGADPDTILHEAIHAIQQ